jgi:hypothetical protein
MGIDNILLSDQANLSAMAWTVGLELVANWVLVPAGFIDTIAG